MSRSLCHLTSTYQYRNISMYIEIYQYNINTIYHPINKYTYMYKYKDIHITISFNISQYIIISLYPYISKSMYHYINIHIYIYQYT